jgi:hypothetical protein
MARNSRLTENVDDTFVGSREQDEQILNKGSKRRHGQRILQVVQVEL